jgi:hypothetical protein
MSHWPMIASQALPSMLTRGASSQGVLIPFNPRESLVL